MVGSWRDFEMFGTVAGQQVESTVKLYGSNQNCLR